MPNAQFKGSNIRIQDLAISTARGMPIIHITAQFVDDEGYVHGIIKHDYSVTTDDATDELPATVKTLLALLVTRLETAHFGAPTQAPRQVIHGIAEAIGGGSSSSDEPYRQG